MAEPSSEHITGMLLLWSQGDEHALDDLMVLVYPDLHRLAAYLLKGERSGHTLQPTALVNEAYLKLAGAAKIVWQNQTHFKAIAARAMRQVLIDYARKRKREIHGGNVMFIPLDEAFVFAEKRSADLLAMDDAMIRLATAYPRHAKIIELHFYGGLTHGEIAEILQIHPNTVGRNFEFASAWLLKDMESKKNGGDTV